MKYIPPIGATDPNESYTTGNPALGIPAKAVPHEAIEHPMREMEYAIQQAGITPEHGNTTQLYAALVAIATSVATPLSDGDYGDITVTAGATQMIINDGVVGTDELAANAATNAKMAKMGARTIKGNQGASTADAADIAVLVNQAVGRRSSGSGLLQSVSDLGWDLIGSTTTGAVCAALGTISVIRTQIFTASGTYTPHANMVYCVIEMTGGGGGGANSAGSQIGAGGGGAGAYIRAIRTKADIGASRAVTIGAGGNNGASGTAGGNTTVAGVGTANGGGGGTTNNGGNGGTGSATSGDILLHGGDGTSSVSYGAGVGGSNPLGQGGGNQYLTPFTGKAGKTGGGGGGGGYNTANGANGGAGLVIITEFCTA
ncbi:MAG: hypothetical protein FJX23_07415 [Alphaproteobacteria bacterium]|nr:hypothetical protein [Alphaproteobacteria bacterium]